MIKNPFKKEVPIESNFVETQQPKETKKSYEIESVIFDPGSNVVVGGIQVSGIKVGWKNCSISMIEDGILIEIPGFQSSYVHRSKTRQINFK